MRGADDGLAVLDAAIAEHSPSHTVWIIESGYSDDYSVHCAFTTRDLAIAYAAEQNKVPVDDMRLWQDAHDLSGPARRTAFEALPAHLRHESFRYGYTINTLDLYDTLPTAE